MVGIAGYILTLTDPPNENLMSKLLEANKIKKAFKKCQEKIYREYDWSIFSHQNFFLPSCSAVVLRGTNTAVPRRYIVLLVSLPNNIEVKAGTMKNCSHNPKRLAQARRD